VCVCACVLEREMNSCAMRYECIKVWVMHVLRYGL